MTYNKEEKEAIIKAAYETYKQQETELYDILDLAYLDLVTDNNSLQSSYIKGNKP